MSIEQDLARIELQEKRLRFKSFDADAAWEVGSRLRAAAAARGAAVAIEIRVNGHMLFFTAMEGTTPDNLDWIRRKVNVVQRFHRSSYAVGLQLAQKGISITEQCEAPECDFATHGGCFPIRLAGSPCIGTITVSGLPQRDDHELVVATLAELLGEKIGELALGAE